MVMKIAVLGAGVSGLAVLRRLREKQDAFDVVCFDQLPSVGGLWNYCDVISDASHPTGSQYSAVYENLMTNLPKNVMEFVDFPFSSDLPDFMKHTDVKEYLDNFADHFKLKDFIKLNKRVTSIVPLNVLGHEDKWTMKICDVNTKMEEEFVFDAVIVCNGQFFKPSYPKVKGLDQFKGQIIHSQSYRRPEDYKGKNVLLIGGGPSGIDIACEVCQFANKTWLSHSWNIKLTIPDSIEQIGRIIQYTSDSAIFHAVNYIQTDMKNIIQFFAGGAETGGTTLFQSFKSTKSDKTPSIEVTDTISSIDVIIFCTGFEYSYPFLNADSGVAVQTPLTVGPLYKDIVPYGRPRLFFVGIPKGAVRFHIADGQSQFLIALLEGRISMPSSGPEIAVEIKAFNELKAAEGVNVWKDPHEYIKFQWTYLKCLAKMADFEPPPFYVEDLFKKVFIDRLISLSDYKLVKYKKGEDGLFVRV